MAIELPKEKYREIRHLFEDKSYLNIFRSHLERTPIKKSVYVDNLENPQTAVMIVIPRLFFGGKGDNRAFNSEFREFLFGKLKNEFLDRSQHEVDCYFANEDWKEGVKHVLIEPYFYDRYYYEIKELKQANWRDIIPERYSIEPVNLSLLEKNYLENYDWLIEEIEENWLPFEENLKEIKGFYLVKEDKEIVAWCTLEYLTDENEIEVGIATREEYRKKGFATIVGSATAEYALTKYKSVGWNCSISNVGSWKTAEKIGYELQMQYTKAGCFFNKIDNWIVHGFTQAGNKNYEKALEWYEKVLQAFFEKDSDFKDSVLTGEYFPMRRLMFRLASYYAALGDKKNSFKNLQLALDNGFDDRKLLEEDELLKSLHNDKQWQELLLEMKEN